MRGIVELDRPLDGAIEVVVAKLASLGLITDASNAGRPIVLTRFGTSVAEYLDARSRRFGA